MAMPTKGEIEQTQSLVNELMKPCITELKNRSMSATEVGDKAVEFSGEAETQAAKYLFLKGAVSYYVRDKAYDKAADAIESIMAQFPDIEPETLLDITSRAKRVVTSKTAPRLFAIHNTIVARVNGAKALKAMEAELRKKPTDRALIRNCAELTVATGKWDEALPLFVKLGGDVGKMAQGEIDGTAVSATLADFWWNYKPQQRGAKDAIRSHAVALYRDAIDRDELKGLQKTLAEQRMMEVEAVGEVASSKSRTTPTALSAKLQRGLVGYWPFDGNADDKSGNRNNGIVHGVAPTEDRFGKANKAYRFNRGNFIEVPNSSPLQNIRKDVTITAWVNPHEWDNGFMSVMQKGNQRESQFMLQSGRGTCFYGAGELHESRPWRTGEWQHIALTYEHGNGAKVYQNGELIGVGKADRELAANRLPLLIGYEPWGQAEYFIGDMDDVRLFNRALSEKEIQELYKAEAPKPTGREAHRGAIAEARIPKSDARKNGLIHRWSFSGNLKDSVGGRDGKACDGKVTFENGQVRIRPGGGYVDLGANVIPGGGKDDYTIEIWATKYSIQEWARVFQIPDNWGANDYFWSWNHGVEPRKWQWKVAGYGAWNRQQGDGTGIGVENHFVVVYGHDEEKKPYFHVNIFRGENGYWGRRERLVGDMFKSHHAFWLGHGSRGEVTADASYNEVRIWNRAFTQDEMLQSAKLGPDNVLQEGR